MVHRYHSIVLMIVLCLISQAAVGDAPESHGQVLRNVTQQIMTDAVTGGFSLPVTALSVTIPTSPLNDLVQQSVIRDLRNRIGVIFVEQANADTVLTYHAIEAAVSYGTPFSRTFLGQRVVERFVSIDVELTLTSSITKAVIHSVRKRCTAVDTVLFSQLRLLDDSAPPFVKIVPAQYSFFDSIIEPAVVTIASAVAIYLFFTIRS